MPFVVVFNARNKIIERRLRRYIEEILDYEQAAYMENRRSIYNILNIRNIIERKMH